MAKASKQTNTYVTPKGEVLFPHIVTIDYGTDKYPCREGRFRTSLCLYPREAEALKQKLADEIANAKAFVEEKFNSLKPATRSKLGGTYRFNELGEEEYDRDENPTGRIKFTFKSNAFYETKQGQKKQRVIPVFDSMAQPVRLKEELGNGSEVKIAFSCSPYFIEGSGLGGLTLWLNAVQVVKLVKSGQRDAKDYGFGEEEDGSFVTDNSTPEDMEVFDYNGNNSSDSNGAGAGESEGDF